MGGGVVGKNRWFDRPRRYLGRNLFRILHRQVIGTGTTQGYIFYTGVLGTVLQYTGTSIHVLVIGIKTIRMTCIHECNDHISKKFPFVLKFND